MTKAEADARRNDLVMYLIGLTDENLRSLRVKKLAETWGVYWLVAMKQREIEMRRRGF